MIKTTGVSFFVIRFMWKTCDVCFTVPALSLLDHIIIMANQYLNHFMHFVSVCFYYVL